MSTATLGYLILLLALSAALYAAACNIGGLRNGSERLLDKGRSAIGGLTFLVTLASFLLLAALAASDFSLKYVYDYSATSVPLAYQLAAFWAGNAGSLLLWALVLAVFTAVIAFSGKIDQQLKAAATTILLANVVFFLVSMIFFANPFQANPIAAVEGHGLNPMLRNPWMVIHPVALYLGYVGAAVPFSFAAAWLWLKRQDDGWIRIARPWILLAWLFLSAGNLLGAQWAYIELGWGGYWAWDPVENASFLPWLTASALLHSVLVQERKGMLKIWNMLLVIITYWLTLYGTFLVRSGVLSSVHAFPKSSLSYWFGFFMFAMLAWAVFLMVSRRALLQNEKNITETISKEASFLLNNILMIAAVLIIFLGTNLPLFTNLFTGVERVVGKAWFNRTAGPVLMAVILLMGLCPLISWAKADLGKLGRRLAFQLLAVGVFATVLYFLGLHLFWPLLGFSIVFFGLLTTLEQLVRKLTGKGSQPYGGLIVHLGLILFTMGVVGDGYYSKEMIKTVQAGETITVGQINQYKLTFGGVEARREGVNDVIFAKLPVEKNGRPAGTIQPERIYYPNWDNPRSEVAIMGGPVEDLYVVLAGWDNDGQQGTFEIHINPLANWLWIGGYMTILGVLAAMWPTKKGLGKMG